MESEESNIKLHQTIKDAIANLAPVSQLNSTSKHSEDLSSEYSCLSNDYKEQDNLPMANMPPFAEYKRSIENLSAWLTSTNTNIQEILQSVNQQRASLIVKNLDQLNKYKSLLTRATILNQTMSADLPDEQAKTMNDEITDIKEQWSILIEGLNTLKDRHLSSESINPSPSNYLVQQNENLLNYIENWLTLTRQLLNQFEQINFNTLSSNNQFLSQLKECEEELTRLKNLFDDMTTMEFPSSLVNELRTLATSITTARIQLENRITFLLELDAFFNWLTKFTKKSTNFNQQIIRLVLTEREDYFYELTQSNQYTNDESKEKIEKLIQMWSYLSSLITESPSVVTKQSSPIVPLLSSSTNEQAQVLLNTIVQLGNRQEIEQLRNQIQSLLIYDKDSAIFNLISDRIHNELAKRQLILQQMLIDTTHIDRLRVNFVAHFNTENKAIIAANEITTLIENYPKEMTTQVRQWLNEQQKTRLTAPLAPGDLGEKMDDFEEYLKELEENVLQYQENEPNQTKFRNLLQQIENRPQLPENCSPIDKQRMEFLRSRFLKINIQIEDIQKKNSSIKTNINNTINNIDVLIAHVRDIEAQIHKNDKQPIQDYERLILDCQRILFELNQNLRIPVEQAINTGKRLYSPDKDSSAMESAGEEIGGGGSSSSSPSPSLKKPSDLTLRKVRRHVLQLNQHWKNANNNIQYRLKILQRAQTAVEELRRKCDQLHAHLLEIELAYAHKSQIKALNPEQIPAEIEQAKNLLTTLMSCKSSIDDIQQSAQTVENEYDIHTVNRAEELNQRWEHSVKSISQRIQSLQDSVKNIESEIYSNSVEDPWQRASALNKIPYYINHSDQTTSWDHPKMIELLRSFSNFNDIRFSAYRTAMKLRTLQKRLCLDLTSLRDIINVFEGNEIIDSLNKNIEIIEILDYLQKIFEKTAEEYPQLINVILAVDLTLNCLLNIYDINRTGSIRLISMKMALALLCRGNIEEKYRYIFSLATYENEGRNVLDRQRLSILFQQAIVIPKQLGEVAAFGGSSVEPSVQSCFEFAHNSDVITADDFLEWVKLEPQSLVWLPVMHRLAASEAAKHEARCNICKIYPILGFRYRSLRHFNCDICQNCFFSGKQTKCFKMDHPLQEYYTETTSSEDIRDFFRIFRNKLWTKHRKNPKLGYLPLPQVFDNNTLSTSESQTSPSPLLIPPLTTDPMSSSSVDDEHGIIAQHCRKLNNVISHSPVYFDNDKRNELEAIIHDLEDENRLLQNEYERLCQEHMEKSLIINEQEEQLQINDREILREAKQLRQHKSKLEQRMKILEEHNKQLEKQLQRSKQLLLKESPSPHFHRSMERQTNLLTIDNLFHMADDINRAVGDLVSVITEPHSTTSSTYHPQIVT